MRARRGFSLVELIVALTILAGALIALGRFSMQFAQANARARVVITANELVSARLEQAKAANRYAAIDSLYDAAEPALPGYRGFSRNTVVAQVGGTPADSVDYTVVTVTVAHAALPRAVARSIIIAPF